MLLSCNYLNKERLWRLMWCGSWMHMLWWMRWENFKFFSCFANLWLLINALEGLHKHIRIDICSLKLSIYLFTLRDLKEHCLIKLYLMLFLFQLVDGTWSNAHFCKCMSSLFADHSTLLSKRLSSFASPFLGAKYKISTIVC